jgi:hypothetical protein
MTSPSCPSSVRWVADGEVLDTPLVEPVMQRYNVSQQSWDFDSVVRNYGERTCAVYPRHLWDQLRKYPKCSEFVAAQRQPHGSGRTTPPLALSFSGLYNGAEAMQSQLMQEIRYPEWVNTLLNIDASSEQYKPSWSLSIGSKGSGIQLHETHPRTAVALLYGRKRWALLPPASLQRLVSRSEPEHSLYWRVGLAQSLPAKAWDESVWEALRQVSGFVEVVQEPGTIMVVPDYWGHATANLDDCIAVNVQAAANTQSPPSSQQREMAARMTVMTKDRLDRLSKPSGYLVKGQVLSAIRADPLQSLRDPFLTQTLWRELMRLTARPEGAIHDMCASAASVVAWLRDSAANHSLSPEHAVSVAVSIFPFGVLPARVECVHDAALKAMEVHSPPDPARPSPPHLPQCHLLDALYLPY